MGFYHIQITCLKITFRNVYGKEKEKQKDKIDFFTHEIDKDITKNKKRDREIEEMMNLK